MDIIFLSVITLCSNTELILSMPLDDTLQIIKVGTLIETVYIIIIIITKPQA